MTREEKSLVIEELTAELANNANIYLTDISGLNAGTTSNLRRAAFKANVKMAVVKNTLLAKATYFYLRLVSRLSTWQRRGQYRHPTPYRVL